MKRFIPAFLVLLALLVGYWAWPFFDLRALAAALQAGDVTAINEEVDYTRLRRSLTEQIISAYLRVTGRASQLGRSPRPYAAHGDARALCSIDRDEYDTADRRRASHERNFFGRQYLTAQCFRDHANIYTSLPCERTLASRSFYFRTEQLHNVLKVKYPSHV